MAESEQIYRESCRRLHRIAANFFAINAWSSGADCVIVDRLVLGRILELDRIKAVRLEWIREDVVAWFPHVESLTYSVNDSVGCVYLSRKPISQWMTDSMTDPERAELLAKQNINCIQFVDVDSQDWSESCLLSHLILLAAGLRTP